jgi:hypothetical protein
VREQAGRKSAQPIKLTGTARSIRSNNRLGPAESCVA